MKDKIQHLTALGNRLRAMPEQMEQLALTAERKNPWFVQTFVQYALDAVINEMLSENKLNEWLKRYDVKPVNKTVGLILAGNIPLVGLHDFLCCYVTGCNMKIKLSSKDDVLFTYILKELTAIDPTLSERVEIIDRLKDFDAVIATGSDNTNRYFEYYFRNYPKILRRNRNSVAILNGEENNDDLQKLSDDIFLYFGFGCRNVSKLYIPKEYDVTRLFPAFEKYKWLHQNTKYMNNYDYNRTLMMLNKTQHLANDFVSLTENASIPSPISTIHYEFWNDENLLKEHLQANADKIQCVVSKKPGQWGFASSVSFGQSQHPELWDYADGVDTIRFLLSL